jgi:hypothetical protein
VRVSFALLLMLLAAATAPAASQPAAAAAADRAYQLVGAWSCESAAGANGTMTFTRQSDGSLAMTNAFVTASGDPGTFDEVYRFDPSGSYWSWKATWRDHDDFREAGTAGMWTAQKWFFDGTLNQRPGHDGPVIHRIRMVYTWLTNDSFEREFETFEDGVWKPTSSSVCKRKT